MKINNQIRKMWVKFAKNNYIVSLFSLALILILFVLYFNTAFGAMVKTDHTLDDNAIRQRALSSDIHKLEYLFDGNFTRIKAILRYSKGNNIDPFFTASVIFAESDNQKFATSRVRARGLMQLMVPTAIILAKGIGDNVLATKIAHNPVVLYNPEINIKLGTRFLRDLRSMYSNWEQTLHAYNVGPYAFKLGKRNYRYVNKIMRYFKDFKNLDLSKLHLKYRNYMSYIYRKSVKLLVMR